MIGSYRPISDYAAIGNLHRVALVAPDRRSTVAACPTSTGPSYFAALLDSGKGGRLRVRAVGADEGRQLSVTTSRPLPAHRTPSRVWRFR